MGDRVGVVLQGIGGRDESAEIVLANHVDGGVEVAVRVGVATTNGDLAMPQRRQLERHVRGHADHLYLAARGDDPQRLLQRIATADTVDDVWRAAGELVAEHQ